jgi:RimJ/RimL family protein N-acetyltransferase
MQLKGARCVVRPWRLKDAAAIVPHANNLNVARQLRDRFPHPYTIDNATDFIKFATSAESPNNFAIEVAEEPAGGIGFVCGTDVERFSAEIGYWLGESYWGKGVTTEALVLVTEYAFTQLNMLRLFALPFADNIPSTRVLEKAGYAREGVLRSSSVKFGRPRDQLLYARINDRWENPATS